jgi:transposase
MNRLFVSMDMHKEKIVSVGLPKEQNIPVFREAFAGNDFPRLVKRLQRLAKTYQIEACYEAGPSGYGPARALIKAGIPCRVVAPSLIPRRPGERVKTDARDALELALALRAGTLKFVRIPTPEEEEVRGLVRCREDIAKEVRRIKQVIAHWLLVHGYRVPKGIKSWTPAHRRWMRDLELSSLDRTVLDHYLDVVHMLGERLKLIEEQVLALADTEGFKDRVARLQAFKGFSKLSAMRVIAEVMEFARFPRATSFMKFTGLVPSEYSSSDRIRRGRITKAGNSHLRHVLVEAVQRAQSTARPGRSLSLRLAAVCGPFRQVALSALTRLHHTFWRLTRRGVSAGKVKVALARELAGFVWAMMTIPETPEAATA